MLPPIPARDETKKTDAQGQCTVPFVEIENVPNHGLSYHVMASFHFNGKKYLLSAEKETGPSERVLLGYKYWGEWVQLVAVDSAGEQFFDGRIVVREESDSSPVFELSLQEQPILLPEPRSGHYFIDVMDSEGLATQRTISTKYNRDQPLAPTIRVATDKQAYKPTESVRVELWQDAGPAQVVLQVFNRNIKLFEQMKAVPKTECTFEIALNDDFIGNPLCRVLVISSHGVYELFSTFLVKATSYQLAGTIDVPETLSLGEHLNLTLDVTGSDGSKAAEADIFLSVVTEGRADTRNPLEDFYEWDRPTTPGPRRVGGRPSESRDFSVSTNLWCNARREEHGYPEVYQAHPIKRSEAPLSPTSSKLSRTIYSEHHRTNSEGKLDLSLALAAAEGTYKIVALLSSDGGHFGKAEALFHVG